MAGAADIIITVRAIGTRGGWDVSGWLELESFFLNSSGAWTVEALCGCIATQASWSKCSDHRRLQLLCIQARLPFAIAES